MSSCSESGVSERQSDTDKISLSWLGLSCLQAVTVGVHGEEKKKRLHVLTALVLFSSSEDYMC